MAYDELRIKAGSEEWTLIFVTFFFFFWLHAKVRGDSKMIKMAQIPGS